MIDVIVRWKQLIANVFSFGNPLRQPHRELVAKTAQVHHQMQLVGFDTIRGCHLVLAEGIDKLVLKKGCDFTGNTLYADWATSSVQLAGGNVVENNEFLSTHDLVTRPDVAETLGWVKRLGSSKIVVKAESSILAKARAGWRFDSPYDCAMEALSGLTAIDEAESEE
jgi:hypothetical protein